jgi:hypothetical protein
MAPQAKPFVGGYFQLVLDGFDCGTIQKASGGNVKAEKAEIPQSTEYLVKNQIGNITIEDFKIQCGLSMGKPLQEWIQASLDSNHMYKNGELVVADFNRKAVQSREFKNALITSVGFPAADAAGKDVAYLSVDWAVEDVLDKAGDGAMISKPNNPNQTMFTTHNFRLTIDGLEATTGKCSKVDALTVKQTVTRDATGVDRIHTLCPGKMTMPPLKITFNRNAVESIQKWHYDFVYMGKNDVTQEKTGMLEFLDATRQKVLLAIEFSGLGIMDLKFDELSNNQDKITNCVAEMYCDQIKLKEWMS